MFVGLNMCLYIFSRKEGKFTNQLRYYETCDIRTCIQGMGAQAFVKAQVKA